MKNLFSVLGLMSFSLGAQAAIPLALSGTTIRPRLETRVWALKEPGTGKAISPDAMITLEDGTKVKAADYYAELNAQEKFLNEQGVSLYDEDEDLGFVAVEESKKTMLNAQLMTFERAPILMTPIKTIPVVIAVPAPVKPCNSDDRYRRYEPWNKMLGSDRFSAGINTELTLDATCTTSLAKGRASFTAKAFFIGYDVATIKVQANSDAAKYAYNYEFLIAGYKVKSDSETSQNPLNFSDNIAKTFSKSGSISYPIGPINATLRFGVKGSAGVNYSLKSKNLTAEGGIGPHADLDAYLEGGVNAYVAEGGVGGEFELVKVEVKANGLIEITPRGSDLYFHGKAFGTYDIDALDGRLYAYVKVKVPAWSWPPYRTKTYSVDVANWDGIHANGTFLNKDEYIKIDSTQVDI